MHLVVLKRIPSGATWVGFKIVATGLPAWNYTTGYGTLATILSFLIKYLVSQENIL